MFRMLQVGILGLVLGLPFAVPQASEAAAPAPGYHHGRVVRYGPVYGPYRWYDWRYGTWYFRR